MKKIQIFIALVIILFTFVACNDFNKKSQLGEQITDEIINCESYTQNDSYQDSIKNIFSYGVKDALKIMNKLNSDNAKVKERLNMLESKKKLKDYTSIISLLLSIIAIILLFIKNRNLKKEINKLSNIKDDLNRKIEKIQNEISHINSNNPTLSKQNFESHFSRLENKIKEVEEKFLSLNQNQTSIILDEKEPINELPSINKKELYAKSGVDNSFTEIYDTNKEGCVFIISIGSNENHGVFNIISLERIQSKNDWQNKVECIGVSINDAQKFEIIENGECEKIDSETWVVTKPLKIKLLR